MKIFSKDMFYKKQENKLYLIKDGLENTSVIGSYTFEYRGGTSPSYISYTHGDGYVSWRCRLWSSSMWYTSNAIDYSKYSVLKIDMECPNIINEYSKAFPFRYGDEIPESQCVNISPKETTMSRQVIQMQIPSWISSLTKEFYINIMNTANEIRVYNMWLER